MVFSNLLMAKFPSAPRANAGQLIAGILILILALIAATATVLETSYRDTLHQEKTALRNLSFAFSVQTVGAAQSIDQVLAEVQREFLLHPQHRQLRTLPRHLSDKNLEQLPLLGIYLFDSEKRLLASTQETANGTSPPAPPALPPDQRLRIDISDINAETGHAVLSFTRPLLDASGNAAGVIMAQVNSAYFQSLYASVELGKGGSVTLLHRDGTMLVRGPSVPRFIGQPFQHTPLFQKQLPAREHGSFESASPFDGTPRIYGYGAVTGYPLVIITGMDKSDALALWYDRLWTTMLFLGLVILLVLFLAWRVARDAKRLAHGADYLKSILNTIGNPISVLDDKRRYVLLNDAFRRFVGKRDDELLGRVDAEALEIKELAQTPDDSGNIVTEGDLLNGDGERRTVIKVTSTLSNAKGISEIVNVLTDITDRKKAEVRLAYVADYDTLTALPNQAHFRRLLQAAVTDAALTDQRLGVIIVSLERLQEINDLIGHEAGDQALQQAANIFRSFIPAPACIARVKSNEFAVLVNCDPTGLELEDFAEGLHAALSAPVVVFEREFYLGPLIGVSTFPQDARSADELFRLADIARHTSGSERTSPVHFFSQNTHTRLDQQLMLERHLRRAMARNEFRVVYQPKVDISTGKIVGFEALLRWTSTVLGAVSPVRFIPIAEATGLILEIGAWVLLEACHQAMRWTRHQGAPIKVAVNLSLRQFHQKELVPMIRQCLDASGLPPTSLELEITESTVMSRAYEVDALMHDIRALGVELSVDDFGTGYSSLAYLKRFPVQRLKIDRAFISDLGHDEDSLAIVNSIITLGHGLKLRVVAEGVETDRQLALLLALSCDEYQGFLFSRPVEADEVLNLLAQDREAGTRPRLI